jgi:hypothetical protein
MRLSSPSSMAIVRSTRTDPIHVTIEAGSAAAGDLSLRNAPPIFVEGAYPRARVSREVLRSPRKQSRRVSDCQHRRWQSADGRHLNAVLTAGLPRWKPPVLKRSVTAPIPPMSFSTFWPVNMNPLHRQHHDAGRTDASPYADRRLCRPKRRSLGQMSHASVSSWKSIF